MSLFHSDWLAFPVSFLRASNSDLSFINPTTQRPYSAAKTISIMAIEYSFKNFSTIHEMKQKNSGTHGMVGKIQAPALGSLPFFKWVIFPFKASEASIINERTSAAITVIM